MNDLKADTKTETKSKIAELEERLKAAEAKAQAAEAKVLTGEEGALDRVCKALKVTPDVIKAKEIELANKEPEKLIRCWVSHRVMINGRPYEGDVTVPYGTFEVISQALGDRYMRLLREQTGNNYILKELTSGGFAPQITGSIDAAGQTISTPRSA